MTQNTAKNIEKTANNSENQNQQHPLKNTTFHGIPKSINLIPGLSDRVFRLLAIIFSSFGDDGFIEYKIKTLEKLLQKSNRSTRETIAEATKKGFITTRQTGRSLRFYLTEKCYQTRPQEWQKTATQSGEKPPLLYHLEKKVIKKTTAGAIKPPAIEPKTEQKQQPKKHAAALLIAQKLQERIRPDRREKIPLSLIKKSIDRHKRSEPQIEFLIDKINALDKCQNPGGYFNTLASDQTIDLLAPQKPAIVDHRKKYLELQAKIDRVKNIPVEGFASGAQAMRAALNRGKANAASQLTRH